MENHIHYIRNAKGMPVACVAFSDSFNSANRVVVVRYGYSVHNPSDPWNRKLARQIAIGRMVDSPNVFSEALSNDTDYNINSMIRGIMRDMLSRNIPNRLLKEVRYYDSLYSY